jgi:hypothetical protein
MPSLERLQKDGEIRVVVVNTGDLPSTADWARELGVRFPVLVQEGYELSKRYEVYATPFAFVIDERGVVLSRGLVGNARQIGFVLSAANEFMNEVQSDGSAQPRRQVQQA